MARWDGKTVVCIASGPSLTQVDCDAVRASGLPAIVTNNTWQLAPWADALYAGDYQWWRRYAQECTFAGERWTCSERASTEFKLKFHRVAGEYNTGARAMQLAKSLGASRILMLGYDMDFGADGAVHWHGAHQRGRDAKGQRILVGNPTADRFRIWQRLFTRLASELKPAEVLNCSRRTALTCFKTADLQEALC